jgi:hypothetical protein
MYTLVGVQAYFTYAITRDLKIACIRKCKVTPSHEILGCYNRRPEIISRPLASYTRVTRELLASDSLRHYNRAAKPEMYSEQLLSEQLDQGATQA